MKGLHTKSAESVARRARVRGGGVGHGLAAVYMVDANFLSYTTVPIEHQRRVRGGNDKNDHA